jgi:8-oxo-dGTP diphosphatase
VTNSGPGAEWSVACRAAEVALLGWIGEGAVLDRHTWGGGGMPYLVRHAHAGDKRGWAGPDRLRPLSGAGRGEAHGLLTQLGDYRITRILSSPALRCLETVEPLARRRGLTVERSELLGVDADPAVLVALLVDPAAADAVLCSHGELIGTALRRLAEDDTDAGSLVWPKGSTWVLETDDGRVSHRRYLPPLRLHDTDADDGPS